MRTFKKFVPLLVALLSITTQVHAADVPATFNFTGAGYGHGSGMSQIGAKARATTGGSATARGGAAAAAASAQGSRNIWRKRNSNIEVLLQEC